MSNIYNATNANRMIAPVAVIVGKARKEIAHSAERIAEAKKRRQTIAKHIRKVYAGKQFTVDDIKKSLALQIRNWKVEQVTAEINFCLASAGAVKVGKLKKEGKKGPAMNVFSLVD